jgi:hypothetical protein
MKSWNLNFLEPSGPLQACNGTALPLHLSALTVILRHLWCNSLWSYADSGENTASIFVPNDLCSGFNQDQSMWDLWWMKWHWDTFFLRDLRVFPVSITPLAALYSFVHLCVLITWGVVEDYIHSFTYVTSEIGASLKIIFIRSSMWPQKLGRRWRFYYVFKDFLLRNSPQWAMISLLSGPHNHIQTHHTR